jgi:hypothetical protein
MFFAQFGIHAVKVIAFGVVNVGFLGKITVGAMSLQ